MSGDTPIIRLRGIQTRFGTQTIHDGLDLDVRRGEVLGVVGGSGTGKSVLLRTIIGLKRPEGGSIEIFGQPFPETRAAARAVQSRWGVLFQNGALFSALTVAQNVRVPFLEHTRLDHKLVGELIRVKIELAGLPPEAGAKYPSELSGGMRKRAALARALAPISAAAFDGLIRDLQRALGLTVVIVTHDLDTLVTITDRIAVLVDKRIIVAPLADHLENPHPWIRSYFHGPRGRAARHEP